MLFDDQDRARIEALIGEVERSTAGEIVCLVAPQSDDYGSWRAGVTAVITIAAALAVFVLVPDLAGEWILAGQAPAAVMIYWLAGWGPLLRALLPRPLAASAVDARAKHMFVERGVTETRDRSGVLIFLSELEHRVEILADRGIHERLGVEEWERDVQQIVDAIRRGETADGVCQVIERIGAQLAEAFPPRKDDVDELSNKVVRTE